MTACPICKSEDVRVGWPEERVRVMECKVTWREPAVMRQGLLVPLACRACGHKWSIRSLPLPTAGELADKEEAGA